MALESGRTSPPQWSQLVLAACIPDELLRDAIVGDLHQELVRDTTHMDAWLARLRYRQRVAGIVGYVVLDTLRLRPWTGSPAAQAVTSRPVAAAVPRSPALLRRSDFGVLFAAFGVLGLGIVVNTVLFSSSHHGVGRAAAAGASSAALGVLSLVLTLGCAAVAAVMLCVGPRWLRRRACRDRMLAASGSAVAATGVGGSQPT